MAVVEHNNVRVLTTEQVAEAYGCEPKQVKQNFNNNKDRFTEGVHYFKLEGDSLKCFKRQVENFDLPLSKFASTIYLWTKKGASRHCKMLGTDKAWDVFDLLEENYFNPKAKNSQPQDSYMIADPIERARRWIEEEQHRKALVAQIEGDRPKVVFADAVSVAKTNILVGELAKILKQNGVEIGEKRLFQWLREKGYLIKRKGTDYNMPTQRSMDMKLFEIKETAINHSDGHTSVNKTPKVTGRGQMYFVNLFLKNSEEESVGA